MKFLILSENAAVNIVPRLDIPHAIISIIDPTTKEPVKFPITNLTTHVLQLKFFDLDGNNTTRLTDKYISGLFTDEQAVQIINFVEDISNVIDTLVVHCGAGISRSAGIVAALSNIYNGSDQWVFTNKRYLPNRWVYRKILNVYNNIQGG